VRHHADSHLSKWQDREDLDRAERASANLVSSLVIGAANDEALVRTALACPVPTNKQNAGSRTSSSSEHQMYGRGEINVLLIGAIQNDELFYVAPVSPSTR